MTKTQELFSSLVSRPSSLAYVLFLILLISGCATTKTYQPPETKVEGFYHEVKAKETLSMISKNYNVGIDDIIEANKIPDKNKISVGQLIFIPKKNAE